MGPGWSQSDPVLEASNGETIHWVPHGFGVLPLRNSPGLS